MKGTKKGGVPTAGLVVAAVLAAMTPVRAGAIDWGRKELANEQVAVKVAREAVRGGYGLVVTDELKRRLDAGEPMLVVDTMPRKDGYDRQHIPGAVQFEFPVEEMQEMPAERQAAYARLLGDDKGRGAVWAKRLGYANVVRYVGGVKAWEEADYPVEKAKE